MKKIKFKSSLLKKEGVLTREQLKNVLGGESVVTTSEIEGACEGKSPGDPCNLRGRTGVCKLGGTGPMICYI